jgi:hypothetical protein
MAAMLTMKKLEIDVLERAAGQPESPVA